MANLTHTQDVKQAVLKHAGELVNGNSPYEALVIEYINRVYQEILAGGNTFLPNFGESWPWAKAQNSSVLQLDPPYDTGTVTLTKGSTSGTFSSAPAATMAGRFLKIDERPEIFRISAHTAAATAFTLDAAYTDDSGAGLSFNAHKLDYTLTASIQRLIEPMRTYRSQTDAEDSTGKIYGIGLETLSSKFPMRDLTTGVPANFAVAGEVDGTLRVRFSHSVSTETRVEYDFIAIPSDLTDSTSSIPLLPREDRMVLVYGATYFLMLDKNDNRAQAYLQLAQSKLQAMVAALQKETRESGKNFGRMLPRQEEMPNTRLKTSSGLIIS